MIRKRTVLIISIASLALTGCVNVSFTTDMSQEAQTGTQEGKTSDPGAPKDTDGSMNLPVKEEICLDPDWEYASLSEISSGSAVLYRATSDRKDIVIGVNAGHGTAGGETKRTYCHPDKSPKITDGSNPAGSLKAVAISAGMIFSDGTTESEVTLSAARLLRDRLLERGYDVLMLRDDDDVQLDNVARTVIANNKADCLISLHWDGDGLRYDKGCFYIPVPDEIKEMEPVASNWQEHERLGDSIISSLSRKGCPVYRGLVYPLELTQTCYSTIPSVVVELGNAASPHTEKDLVSIVNGLVDGIGSYVLK